jgi:ribose transport system permease protein
MKKTFGILGVLLAVMVYTSVNEPAFLSAYNLHNILQRASLYGIVGIGVAFVIMSGGIDLSIGSIIGLVGCIVPLLLLRNWPPYLTLLAGLAVAAILGLGHGLLITKMRLQPFVVTLCGLLLYRGAARYIADDKTLGLHGDFEKLRYLAVGKVSIPFLDDIRGVLENLAWRLSGRQPEQASDSFTVPVQLFILLGIALLAAVFLNRTIYGRYLLAVGRNEQAARFSGINTDRIVIASYVLSAILAGGVGGLLFLFYQESVQPDSHGNAYELYAIAAAVLGGCSLRGGEGSIFGVILGATLIPVLYNASNVLGLPTTLEFAVIGFAILTAAIVDEAVRRIAAARRRRLEKG